jgi:gamma-glutamyl:cysteine ligase YbdK (ATP-grasp superfamily)
VSGMRRGSGPTIDAAAEQSNAKKVLDRMLADIPHFDRSPGATRRYSEELPESASPATGDADTQVRRVGLEQEFFLVDLEGTLCDLADAFLRRCREAAVAAGLDPLCFKSECVKSMVEITTPPCSGVADLTGSYLSNLTLALEVGSELGLELYPLGTYPLPTSSEARDAPDYGIQVRIVGHERYAHAGRCAGTHLHLELPAGTIWPDVTAALDAPAAAQRELMGLYNLATALDPALVALSRSCPYYEGRAGGFAARTARYRGMLGLEGPFADLYEVVALSPYAARVEDFVDYQNERYAAWYAALDRAGIDRRLFAPARINMHGVSWNPIRLNHHGTVEIRSMDANYPAVILAICSLISAAVDRLRREHLRVVPTRQVRTLEVRGDRLLVPHFSYLSGDLLGAAVTRGVPDERIEAYLDSFLGFALAYAEEQDVLEPLGALGSYKSTESDILESFPPVEARVTRGQGLPLVRDACRRLKQQVSSLSQRHGVTQPRRDEGAVAQRSFGPPDHGEQRKDNSEANDASP